MKLVCNWKQFKSTQHSATPEYLQWTPKECNIEVFRSRGQENLYAIENDSKVHNNKKHQSTYSKHQKQSATPKYCNGTQKFMYTKKILMHTLECKNAFHNASKA
jgi:hypothetical protein